MMWRVIVIFLWSIDCVIWAQNPIGLCASASLRGLLLGTAILIHNIDKNVDNGNYTSNLKKNYQLVIPEMGMKPQQIWTGENEYNWTVGDWLMGGTLNTTGWTQQNDMQVSGHILIWAGDVHAPAWLLEQEANITSDKAKQLLNDYIHAVVSRYRGKTKWWTVMNEAIDDKNNTNPFNLRDCFWLRKLGVDFMKYAFMFAYEANPDVELYYNEYGIERIGLKANRTIAMINWLQSQGVIVHGIGLQFHIWTGNSITPGDAYYQSAQQFIDNNLNIMVTELDIAMPMKDGKPIYPGDIQRQGLVYRDVLQYVLHFFPKCSTLITWGFTDRYSWIPAAFNYTAGDGLPLDWFYQHKPAYWQLQEELARVLIDGLYCLSPKSQSDKYLIPSVNNTVQLTNGDCNDSKYQWNITWLGDGTYCLSPVDSNTRALYIYNASATIGQVQMSNWSNDFREEWVFTYKNHNIYRIAPRNAWSRIMTIDETTNTVVVIDDKYIDNQTWILTNSQINLS